MTGCSRVVRGSWVAACAVGVALTWTAPAPRPEWQPWIDSPMEVLRPHVEGATRVVLVTDHDRTETHLLMKYALLPKAVVTVHGFEEAAELALDGACIVARFTNPRVGERSLQDTLAWARAAGVEVAMSEVGPWLVLRAKRP